MINAPSDKMPEKAQDGISRVQKVAAAEKYFGGRFWSFGNISEFIGQELGLEELRGAHKPSGRAPMAYGLLETPLTSSPSPTCVFWSKKNHCESFIPFGLRLVFLFYKTHKQGKKHKLAPGSELIS